MSETTELLACPFCGNPDLQVVTEIADWPSVVCSASLGGCGASSGLCPSGSPDAIAAWNRRTVSAELRAELAWAVADSNCGPRTTALLDALHAALPGARDAEDRYTLTDAGRDALKGGE